MSPRHTALNFKDYDPDMKASLVQRAANALDWAANNFPRQLVPYNILLKTIMGFGHTPRLGGNNVEELRSSMSRVRRVLRIKYGKGLVSEPGAGVRATVDSTDQLRTDVRKAAQRHHSSGQALTNAFSIVNMSEIPNTPENKKLLQWAKTGLREQLATIASPEFKKLLEPISNDDV
jgi:hypothetical protein